MELNEPKLKISKEKIIKTYRDTQKCIDNGLNVEINEAMLLSYEELFGKDFFQHDITDRVKSFEDAWKIETNLNEVVNINFYFLPKNIRQKTEVFIKLATITKVLNEDKLIKGQRLYFPVFNLEDDDFKYYFYTTNGVQYFQFPFGFHKPELAEYAGKQFIDLFKILLT